MKKNLHYLIQHWKLGFHLIFRTRRLGVNNQLYSRFPSPYGESPLKIIYSILLIYPLIRNFKLMKWRMGPSMGFTPREEYFLVFKKNDKLTP